jgi:hypothetical protein
MNQIQFTVNKVMLQQVPLGLWYLSYYFKGILPITFITNTISPITDKRHSQMTQTR